MKPKTIHIKDKKPSLKELQTLVGGYIEILYDNGKIQMICNEEGKLFNLPYNNKATDLWYKLLKEDKVKYTFSIFGDELVGDVVVLYDKARID